LLTLLTLEQQSFTVEMQKNVDILVQLNLHQKQLQNPNSFVFPA
jgi:hypothetical protein